MGRIYIAVYINEVSLKTLYIRLSLVIGNQSLPLPQRQFRRGTVAADYVRRLAILTGTNLHTWVERGNRDKVPCLLWESEPMTLGSLVQHNDIIPTRP